MLEIYISAPALIAYQVLCVIKPIIIIEEFRLINIYTFYYEYSFINSIMDHIKHKLIVIRIYFIYSIRYLCYNIIPFKMTKVAKRVEKTKFKMTDE